MGCRQNPGISLTQNAWFERVTHRIGPVTLLDLTVQRGLLETDQAERVREETARTGESLAAAIVRMGFANGLALAEASWRQQAAARQQLRKSWPT